MSQWEDKCWGKTMCVEDSPLLTIHELELEAGGVCSYHYHKKRANVFLVRKGLVRVVYTIGWDVFEEVLGPGTDFRIPALVAHQFQVLESGEMREIYYPDNRSKTVNVNDITRLVEGCKVDPKELIMREKLIVSQGEFITLGGLTNP